MNKESLQHRIELLTQELEYHQNIKTNCSNCYHSGNDVCLMWDAKVPDDVKLIGCDDWEFDNVPF